MNAISRLANVSKNAKIGQNNVIHNNVTIMDDVEIGNGNKIFPGTVIYPNTIIGNNNIFLERNIIGEFAIEAKHCFTEKKFGGLKIGNNNYFHVSNLIFNGYHNNTIIGNYNKFLAEIHMGHDSVVENDVHIYPRCLIGGFTKLQSNAGMGTGSYIQQCLKTGEYSFTAMNDSVVKNCFPFLIYIGNKPIRMNTHRVPEDYHIYEQALLELANMYHKDKNEVVEENLDRYNFPEFINNIIKKFISN